MHKRADVLGQSLANGDQVFIRRIPDELVRGLPASDQRAISSCLGQRFSILGFDAQSHAEIEFTDSDGVLHTIWIRPDCLEKEM